MLLQVYHFSKVPRLTQRLECHYIGFLWGSGATLCLGQLEAIKKGMGEIKGDEDKLKKLLGVVLSVGNYINGDTARGQVRHCRL